MVRRYCCLLTLGALGYAQMLVNGGRTVLGPLDASGATLTAPNRVGAADPATCNAAKRETFFNTTTNTLKVCTVSNVWSAISGSGGGGLADPGANGLIKRTGAGTTAVATEGVDYVRPSDSITGTAGGITGKTMPAGALIGDTDTQSISNKTFGAGTKVSGTSDWTEVATPSSPSAGSQRIYAKASSGLCALDSGGIERCTGTGSGGGAPGGTADGQVQYKSGATFAADGGLSWNSTNKTLAISRSGTGAAMTIANSVIGYSEIQWTDGAAAPLRLKYGWFNAGSGNHSNWQLYNANTFSLFNVDASGNISMGNNNTNTQTGTLHVMDNYPSTGATRVTFRAGPGQGSTNIWEVAANNGTVMGKVAADGQATFPSLTLTTGSQPACDATQRGKFWYVAGGAGVKDTVNVCAKDAGDAYAWRSLY